MLLQIKGFHGKIARSLSVPANNKEKDLRRVDSFFRVIPSTPCVKEGDASHHISSIELEPGIALKGKLKKAEHFSLISLVFVLSFFEYFKR